MLLGTIATSFGCRCWQGRGGISDEYERCMDTQGGGATAHSMMIGGRHSKVPHTLVLVLGEAGGIPQPS